MKKYLQQDLLPNAAAPPPETYTHVAQLMIFFGFDASLSYPNAPTSLFNFILSNIGPKFSSEGPEDTNRH